MFTIPGIVSQVTGFAFDGDIGEAVEILLEEIKVDCPIYGILSADRIAVLEVAGIKVDSILEALYLSSIEPARGLPVTIREYVELTSALYSTMGARTSGIYDANYLARSHPAALLHGSRSQARIAVGNPTFALANGESALPIAVGNPTFALANGESALPIAVGNPTLRSNGESAKPIEGFLNSAIAQPKEVNTARELLLSPYAAKYLPGTTGYIEGTTGEAVQLMYLAVGRPPQPLPAGTWSEANYLGLARSASGCLYSVLPCYSRTLERPASKPLRGFAIAERCRQAPACVGGTEFRAVESADELRCSLLLGSTLPARKTSRIDPASKPVVYIKLAHSLDSNVVQAVDRLSSAFDAVAIAPTCEATYNYFGGSVFSAQEQPNIIRKPVSACHNIRAVAADFQGSYAVTESIKNP